MSNLMDLICDIDKHRDYIRNTFEKPHVEYDLFDQDDREWLEDFCYQDTVNRRRNDNGTLFFSGGFDTIVTKFQSKLERVLPGCTNSPDIDGNFFITPHQYGLHNDSIPRWRWEENGSKDGHYYPWRNILIPLWQSPKRAQSQIVFFKQRDLDWAKVYKHGSDEEVATTYPVCRNYAEISTFYNRHGEHMQWQDRNMWPEEYLLYLPESPAERYKGLDVELMIDWQPGSAFAFDSWQLHATNRGDPPWNQKSGLLLCFFKMIGSKYG